MVRFSKAVCFLAVLVTAFAPMALAQGTYTRIDFPGASVTRCDGINAAGDVVGIYVNDGDRRQHGFLLSGGVFTPIDTPWQGNTYPTALNDVGQIVGLYGPRNDHGFLYDIQTQTFTKLRYKKDWLVQPTSINNTGTIGGSLMKGVEVGFELNGTDYTAIKLADYFTTFVLSINNLGDVLVGAVGNGGTIDHYLLSGGKPRKLNFDAGVYPTALNDDGDIAGYFVHKVHTVAGFSKHGSAHYTLEFPGFDRTFAFGINDSGVVAGELLDIFGSGDESCFIWTPPADAAKK